jgi:hypothetical protein
MYRHLQKQQVVYFLGENISHFKEPLNIEVTVGLAL